MIPKKKLTTTLTKGIKASKSKKTAAAKIGQYFDILPLKDKALPEKFFAELSSFALLRILP